MEGCDDFGEVFNHCAETQPQLGQGGALTYF